MEKEKKTRCYHGSGSVEFELDCQAGPNSGLKRTSASGCSHNNWQLDEWIKKLTSAAFKSRYIKKIKIHLRTVVYKQQRAHFSANGRRL